MIYIRMLLTTVMLFFIYQETGVVTTIAVGLIAIGLELHAFAVAHLIRTMKANASTIGTLTDAQIRDHMGGRMS